MSKRLFIGNLSPDIDDAELRRHFGAFGSVLHAEAVRGRGRGRGFGFVELESEEDADWAIAEMHGYDLHGRAITVAEARAPRRRTTVDDDYSDHRSRGGNRGDRR